MGGDDTGWTRELLAGFHPAGPELRLWQWRALDRYDNQDTSDPELGLMHCVREYIRLLNHALVPSPVTMARPAVVTAATDPKPSTTVSAPPADWTSLKYYHPEYEHALFPTVMYASPEDVNERRYRDHIIAICMSHGLNHLTAALQSPHRLSSVAAKFFPIFDEKNQVLDPCSLLIPHQAFFDEANLQVPTGPWVSVAERIPRRTMFDAHEWMRKETSFFPSRLRARFDIQLSMSHLCRQRAWALFESHHKIDYIGEAANARLPDGDRYVRFVRKHLEQLYNPPCGRGSQGRPLVKITKRPPSDHRFELRPPAGQRVYWRERMKAVLAYATPRGQCGLSFQVPASGNSGRPRTQLHE